jgi:hypothetical protein
VAGAGFGGGVGVPEPVPVAGVAEGAGENSVDLIGTAKVKILPTTDSDVSLSPVAAD